MISRQGSREGSDAVFSFGRQESKESETRASEAGQNISRHTSKDGGDLKPPETIKMLSRQASKESERPLEPPPASFKGFSRQASKDGSARPSDPFRSFSRQASKESERPPDSERNLSRQSSKEVDLHIWEVFVNPDTHQELFITDQGFYVYNESRSTISAHS